MNRYFLIIFILFFSCSQPDLLHTTAANLQETLVNEHGQHAVLLNFWATWCEPCLVEFPMIVEIAEKNKDDLKVYFVSVDWLDEEQKVVLFLKEQGVHWTAFIKGENDQDFINGIHRDWSGAVPFTILYGKTSGEVVDFWEGEQPAERFKNAVQKAINL